jgi:hypothetical protein
LDGHPEVATLPGVYLKGWFGSDLWRRLNSSSSKADWREHLVAKVSKEFQPLFDANCKHNVVGKPFSNSKWLAKDQGFMEMGPDRLRPLVLDQEAFSKQFLFLLQSFTSIGIKECFELIHLAFEITIRGNTFSGSQSNCHIFYHIHNPNPYEHAYFLKHYPHARVLHIMRNPVQNMESWMIMESLDETGHSSDTRKSNFKNKFLIKRWVRMVSKVTELFIQIQSPFNNKAHSRGIRLEDVKRKAIETMPQIADWMGISDNPALYESSFCGLQYWGPSSKSTGNITGFSTKAIDLPVGRFLGSRDVLIFETLFWPFSRLYNYTNLDHAGFRQQLSQIRPWLDEPLEFERRLYEELDHQTCALKDLAPYIRLHHQLLLLWTLLDSNDTYSNMVVPLDLNR